MAKPALPASETHFGFNLLAALFGLYLAYRLGAASSLDTTLRLILILLGVALPILLADMFWRRAGSHAAAGLTARRRTDARRVAVKTLGLYATLGFFGLLYWLLPVYHQEFYTDYWKLLRWLVPFIALTAPFYFAWCDARQDIPEDAYYHLGRLMLGKAPRAHARSIGVLLRNWLVKAFFLPLMFVYLSQNILTLPSFGALEPHRLYSAASNLLYTLDLLIACVGYGFTLRCANAHIRSSEPTFFGWAVTLACYMPFWGMLLYPQYFQYDTHGNFTSFLREDPVLTGIVSAAIILMIAIYASATVALGIRFSNLTYRGLVTGGPYRFCKHPAYVAKNISWWLVSMPFLAGATGGQAIKSCLLLCGVNLLYFLRARTEERHLSNYPEYVAYAEAMNERSLFAPLARLIPALRYAKPDHPPRID